MATLKDQLRALQDDEPKSLDPESAYADLDGHQLGAADRAHYEDVGPSRLRAAAGVDAAQTLLSDKYGGKASSRMKIFDDDDEEEEEEADEGEDDEEEDDEDEEEEDEEDEDEEEEEDDEEEDEEDEEEEPTPKPSGKALDPVGQLRASRLKDIEKGRGIKRQRDLFDSLLTMRIAFQKAVPSAFSLPPMDEVHDDPEHEIDAKRSDVLSSLAELNETLFSLRELISLPGAEAPAKKRRVGEPSDGAYWTASAADSFALADAAHPALVPILSKWSTKIQAASLSTNKPGGSKFAAAKQTGVVDAIDAALSSKRDAPKPLLEAEETAYRGLLREVIESRGGGDVMAHRREKKKKREAERGGSKGRKLRYTVHDKAVNFVVPIPFEGGWEEEQVDDLFSNLFGGAGMKGAVSAAPVTNGTDLGGLRIF
ncbi:TRAUB-domain-containing protein [Cutaneotrichosporon oleaginosum]|uniref:Protein BFR2 n=1 Tax=Cutaneotrichosporon oleaginosum TaxID=879819 RepID=A0A0J1B9C3_9TREE|nr:TRAUB-domain-containing protein [Cutaneotrichosporon oleaginosum]KLT44419.1 TRAUB-domain-containing protein [Cutaneotrichosporon oleaginosum]TXT07861.1 hypothetical protein COLE_04785 [Cutaneotrichosporon oleaginosum]